MTANKYLLPALLIVFAVYAHFLSNDWACDDKDIIKTNTALSSFSNVTKLFSKQYFEVSKEASYRPVSTLVYLVIAGLFGQGPFYFHLSSLILHLLVVTGLFFLVLKLFNSKPAALVAALMFGLHPVNSEAVFCASFNKDIIVALCMVCLLNIRLKNPYGSPWKPSAFLTAALLLLVCLFTKETGVIFIALLFVYDMIFARDELLHTRNAKILYAILIALSVIYLAVRFKFIATPKSVGRYFGGSLYSNILTVPGVMLNYFKLYLAPFHLSIEHAMKAVTSLSWQALATDIALIGSCILFLVFSRRDKVICFSFLWILISFIPVLNFIPFMNHTFWAERYMYLGTIGFSLITASVFSKLFSTGGKVKLISQISLILIFMGYSSILFARGFNWDGGKNLFIHDLKNNPGGFSLNCSLGDIYTKEGDNASAIKCYERVLKWNDMSQLGSQAVVPYLNLSRFYIMSGCNSLAVSISEAGLSVAPKETTGLLLANYAVAEFKLGNYEKAIELNKRAIELDNSTEIGVNLGLCYNKKSTDAEKMFVFFKGIGDVYN